MLKRLQSSGIKKKDYRVNANILYHFDIRWGIWHVHCQNTFQRFIPHGNIKTWASKRIYSVIASHGQSEKSSHGGANCPHENMPLNFCKVGKPHVKIYIESQM
jgi:hypothetical protein